KWGFLECRAARVSESGNFRDVEGGPLAKVFHPHDQPAQIKRLTTSPVPLLLNVNRLRYWQHPSAFGSLQRPAHRHELHPGDTRVDGRGDSDNYGGFLISVSAPEPPPSGSGG